MTMKAFHNWLVMHDVRLSACGERLLVDAPMGFLAVRIVTELCEHKAGLLAIIRRSGDGGDSDGTTGSSPGSGVVSPAMADSAAKAAPSDPWDNSDRLEREAIMAVEAEEERGAFDVDAGM